jgi:hypothetical protein
MALLSPEVMEKANRFLEITHVDDLHGYPFDWSFIAVGFTPLH